MKELNVCGVKALLLLTCFVFWGTSCISEKYDMSGDNLNLEVTPFQEGLELPLGSTDKIKLADLLKDVNGDILSNINGAYTLRVSDHIDDFNSQLSSLTNLVNISDIPHFSEDVSFKLDNINLSDMKIDADTHEFTHEMSSSVKEPEVIIPEVSDVLEMETGIYKYSQALTGVVRDVEISPVTLAKDKVVEMRVEVPLSGGVESVNYVGFTSGSGVDISFSLENFAEGLEGKLIKLEVAFPENLVISDKDVVDNVLTLSNLDLTAGFDRHVGITGINMPAPENGKIDYIDDISLNVVAEVSGTLHSSSIPTDKANDVRIVLGVSSDLVMEDYEVTMMPYPYELDIPAYEIKSEVSADFAGKNISVIPAGEPKLTIDMAFPDFALDITPAVGTGITMSFPKMLDFKEKEIPVSYNYDLKTNSITFFEGSEIPAKIELPVEKLIAAPVEEGGKYYIKGDVEIFGGVSLAGGNLKRKDVQSIIAPGNKLSVVVHIPEIVPDILEMDGTYETMINQIVELDMLSAADVPQQLVEINLIELENAAINVSIDASSLPEKGRENITMDFTLGLPSTIRAEGVDGGVLHFSEKIGSDGKIVLDPIKIYAFDLSGVDLKNDGIKDELVIEGAIRLEDASLDLNDWLGKNFNLKIDAGISEFTIASLAAKVDYALETEPISMDLSSFTSVLGDNGMETTLDLIHAHLALDVTTNLGVNMDAVLEIVPYYGNVADEDGVIRARLNLTPELAQGTGGNMVPVTKVSKFWLAEKEDSRCPDGYELVEVNNLLKLFKNIPDRLEIKVDGGVDPENVCYLDMSNDPVLTLDYAFEVPLEFGEDFKVVYKTEFSGLPEIVGEVLASGLKVKLKGSVMNALPLGLDLKFNFLDVTGNIIPMLEGTGLQAIKPCSYDVATGKVSASDTELDVVVAIKDPKKARDIKSLQLVFDANSKDAVGIPVTDDAYLQAVLQLSLPEGITVDLKELMNNKNEK